MPVVFVGMGALYAHNVVLFVGAWMGHTELMRAVLREPVHSKRKQAAWNYGDACYDERFLGVHTSAPSG